MTWHNILFIIDPITTLLTRTDSSLALMRAFQQQGATLWIATLDDLYLRQDKVYARAQAVELSQAYMELPYGQVLPAGTPSCHLLQEAEQELAAMQCVLMRKDPPFDSEFLFALYLLQQAERSGATVINPPASVLAMNEKLSIAAFPEFIAPTLVTRSPARLQAFWQEHRDIVIKPLDGMGGLGVFHIGQDGLNLNSVIETLGNQGQRTLMAQKYLPAIAKGDKRILVVDGVPLPYALARIPQEGEVRANMARGGKGYVQPLSSRDQEIASAVAKMLQQKGVFLAGLDVIGDFLTEVNITCPTGLMAISSQTGSDIPKHCVDALAQRLVKRSIHHS